MPYHHKICFSKHCRKWATQAVEIMNGKNKVAFHAPLCGNHSSDSFIVKTGKTIILEEYSDYFNL